MLLLLPSFVTAHILGRLLPYTPAPYPLPPPLPLLSGLGRGPVPSEPRCSFQCFRGAPSHTPTSADLRPHRDLPNRTGTGTFASARGSALVGLVRACATARVGERFFIGVGHQRKVHILERKLVRASTNLAPIPATTPRGALSGLNDRVDYLPRVFVID